MHNTFCDSFTKRDLCEILFKRTYSNEIIRDLKMLNFKIVLTCNRFQRPVQGGGGLWGLSPLPDQGNLWMSGGFQAPMGADY